MVDMSPAAVTERLRLMGELWELSVKLMNAKKVKGLSDEAESDADFVETGEEDSSQAPDSSV